MKILQVVGRSCCLDFECMIQFCNGIWKLATTTIMVDLPRSIITDATSKNCTDTIIIDNVELKVFQLNCRLAIKTQEQSFYGKLTTGCFCPPLEAAIPSG